MGLFFVSFVVNPRLFLARILLKGIAVNCCNPDYGIKWGLKPRI